MYLIVGLGNPEPEYSNTRHNMGFDTINLLADEYKIKLNKAKFKGIYGIGEIENKKVVLLKPQTYMNLSGESIIDIMNFYKIDINNLIVIYDDFDTEKEKIRIRKSGSAGSHNGMKSIIGILKNQEFIRIRVGIGQPKYDNDKINYVIGKISDEDRVSLEKGVEKAKNAIIEILKNNVDIAMNKFN
ncbi:MAG: aminoacyl-tRNA hydrolase [Candidatus Scatovivens sp.]